MAEVAQIDLIQKILGLVLGSIDAGWQEVIVRSHMDDDQSQHAITYLTKSVRAHWKKTCVRLLLSIFACAICAIT